MNKSQAQKIIKACGGYKAVAPQLKTTNGLPMHLTELHRQVSNDVLSKQNKAVLKELLYARITDLEQLALENGEEHE